MLTEGNVGESDSLESAARGPKVVLYGRADCCLCDEALVEIARAAKFVKFSLEKVDVDTAPALAAKYGHEVPVVEIEGRKAFKFRVSERQFRKLIRRVS